MTVSTFARGVTFVLALLTATHAFGIADGGGCTYAPLGRAVREGSAADAEREILASVSRAEANRSVITRLLAGAAAKELWRQQRTVELIEGTDKNSLCEPLLQMALREANVEVVRYLTGAPAGVRPKVPPMILFQCGHFHTETDRFRARRFEAFEVVLRTGRVNVNTTYYDGWTILQRCTEPELVNLFIEHGARLDIRDPDYLGRNLLDFAVLSAVKTDETSSTARSLHAIERARIFSGFMSIQAETERQVRFRCNPNARDERWNPASCDALATFVKATPGTFGK